MLSYSPWRWPALACSCIPCSYAASITCSLSVQQSVKKRDPVCRYGHIGFHVNNVDEACKRFDTLGVEFVKRPDAGKMKGLAFIKVPQQMVLLLVA